jgi:hypothetical protein
MYVTEYPSVLAFMNIFYRVLLSLIPIFANDFAIKFYIRIVGQKGIRTTSFLHQKIATRYNNRPAPFFPST